jgi:hypothetical protein
MWCALILQTLPKSTLEKYLPNVPLSPRAGCHLNLASPLTQLTRSAILEESGLGNLYASQDPLCKTYLETRRKEYGQLKFAGDLMLRDYFWDNSERGLKATRKTTRSQIRRKFLNGCKQTVSFSESHQWILICNTKFNIAKGVVRLNHATPLYVQCFMHENSHPSCFARDSTTEDASRVVVQIRGKNEEGNLFDLIAQASGLATVSKMNYVYDILVGRIEEESQSLHNRKWRTRASEIRNRIASDKRGKQKQRLMIPENIG